MQQRCSIDSSSAIGRCHVFGKHAPILISFTFCSALFYRTQHISIKMLIDFWLKICIWQETKKKKHQEHQIQKNILVAFFSLTLDRRHKWIVCFLAMIIIKSVDDLFVLLLLNNCYDNELPRLIYVKWLIQIVNFVKIAN